MLIGLIMLASGLLLTLGMQKSWQLSLGSILVCGQMVTGGFSVAGAGLHLPAPELAMDGAVSEENGDARLERRRAFMPVPGPPQTVQRSEFLGVIASFLAWAFGN